MRAILLWALCGFLALSAQPQTANLGHQSWSTENGLPQSSVHQIFQSFDGYIWLATEGGAARFDGLNFKIFNQETDPTVFTSNDICCFAQNAPDSLWIGTASGLLQYGPQGLRRYTTADGLPSSTIYALAATDDASLLVLTREGLSQLDLRTNRFSLLNLPHPSTLTQGTDGNVWITSPSGLSQYQHGRFIPVPVSPALPPEPIESLAVQPDHTLWLRTHTTLIQQRDGRQHLWTAGRELPGTRIEAFLPDSRNTLWIGTNKGLVALDAANPQSLPQPIPALNASSVLSLFEDRERNLWVGTESTGLHILRRQNFHSLPDLADLAVNTIVQTTDGALYAGTNGDGLYRYQFGKLKHISTHDGLASDIILSLTPGPDGTLWIGTPDGLNHLADSHIKTYTSADGLPDDLIRSLLLGADGSLWIGTRRGLAHLQNGHFTVLTTSNGLRSDLIGALLQSANQDLWIATLDGLSRLHNGAITTYTTADGLSGNIITALLEDVGGALWIGTKGNGLTQHTAKGFTSLQRPDLPQEINSILEDGVGYLWIGSNRGITRVAPSELNVCGSSPQCALHINSYGLADGMPTEETSANGHPAAWQTTNNLLWFATRKGVAIVDPGHLQQNKLPPPVILERVLIDDTPLDLSPSTKIIAPGHNHYAFEFAGLSYSAPSLVRYRYLLEGFDKEWSQPSTRRSATYTNLPPGRYRFHVQAANNDGVWNETGAAIRFYVRPPFYRTLWFVLSALAIIAALAFLFYRLRVRRLRSQFDAVLAERNRMAREIHDTLAQSFVGVSVQLEIVSQLLTHSQLPAANQQLDRTRDYVREGLAEARRSIWDIRAITAQNTLPTRLTQIVEQSRSENLPTQLNIGGTYRPLSSTVESEVLRIAQESLTNAQRHAQATHITLDLRYHSNRLTLTITDDGRGFNPSDTTLPAQGHFGLQGMRERATQINATLTIKSAPETGTTITLDVPIPATKGMPTHG
ncbi:signal transduction histidine kinase [Edaphobacter aggregans]|uniref:Signal transduction histidine kinase n=1 Tax=Edaphobacter aggregans TaxID=570835 RepID=A0A428MMJ4_9BACT|nr:sensor histidine kinase [Edaphobacter aggregans]RSL18137.1 signal transduction histidine kinase [Edaphobacter aggregans]